MAVHPFDLQARAELAVRSLTSLLDPQRDGLMYFLASWRSRPPRAEHCLWDCGDGSGRHIDALTLVRRMLPPDSISAQPNDGESKIENFMLSLLGSGGLSWIPPEPWARPWGPELLLHGGSASLSPAESLAEISWAQRGTLLGLTSRFLATEDDRFLVAGKHLVDGLLGIAEVHPNGLYFPEGYYRPGGWRFHQPGLSPGLEEINAAALVSLVRFYAATGYPPSLDLALGLASFTVKHALDLHAQGDICGSQLLDHFHTRTNFTLGILELGIISGKDGYIALAKERYQRLKEWGTDFGWFPEGFGCRHGEVCATTDMIEIAIQLGRHVDPAYYADAERYGRNHLLESQFLSLDVLRQAVERLPEEPGSIEEQPAYSTNQGVLESQVGGFASRSTLNDAFHIDAAAMMQCCNAAGARALYDLWRYAVEEEPPENGNSARITVHLRFSIETPGLRLVSEEPRAGRLILIPRRDAILSVRLPMGESLASLVDCESGQMTSLEADKGYVASQVIADHAVMLEYPQAERVAHYQVGSQEHHLECTGYWCGETLMRVEPQGLYHPLYLRRDDLPPVKAYQPANSLINSLV